MIALITFIRCETVDFQVKYFQIYIYFLCVIIAILLVLMRLIIIKTAKSLLFHCLRVRIYLSV